MADLLQSELIKLRAMEPEDIEILYRGKTTPTSGR